MTFDISAIRQKIELVTCIEAGLAESVAQDVSFHMTDWLEDLEEFHRFCQAPDSVSNELAAKLLMNFLLHVPNHVAAAGKLYTGQEVADIFGVGATTASDEYHDDK